MIVPPSYTKKKTEVFMSLILTTIVSFLVSLTTCLVYFWIGKKKSAKKTIQKVAPLRESEQEEKNFYEEDSNVPIKDCTFDNYFTDDPTFIEKMKSMLDNYSVTNPVILRGPTGSGKTHLMRAFENYLLEKEPSRKIRFVSAETFTNEFVDSIKNKTNRVFKEKYRKLNALFIDDFNYLRNKTSTQEELFYTISELIERKAFVCFGLTTPFSLKDSFSDRFINLITGIQIDMPCPGFDAKRRKIMQTFEKANCFINGDLVDYLAKPEVGLNELVGICQKIIFMKQLEGKGCVNLEIDDIKDLIN